MSDLISRKKTIELIRKIGFRQTSTVKSIICAIECVPAEQTTCEGCKHLGKWKTEVEYGYPSPCTNCRRTARDYYEK